MAKFSELKIKFTGDTTNAISSVRQFNAALSESSNQATRSLIGFQKLGDSLTGVGMGLTAALTVPLVGAGLAAIKTAGQMEQATIAFTTMFRSGEKAASFLKDLQAFALRTPFEFKDLQDAARRMLALGFAAEDVIPSLTTIGDAVSALGGGKELVDRVTLALGQMKAKGTAQAEEFRQLAEAGIPAWDALAKKLGVDIPTAMQMVEKRSVSASTAIDAVMKSMRDRFAGGMEAQAKTLLGQWSNVKDQMFKTLSEIGKELLPMATSAVEKGINPLLVKIGELAKAYGDLPPTAKGASLAIAAVAAVGPVAVVAIGTILTNLARIKIAIEGVTIASTALSVAVRASAWPLALATGIYTVSAALGEYYYKQRQVTEDTKKLNEKVGDVAALVTNSGQKINNAFTTSINGVYDWLKGVDEATGGAKRHAAMTKEQQKALDDAAKSYQKWLAEFPKGKVLSDAASNSWQILMEKIGMVATRKQELIKSIAALQVVQETELATITALNEQYGIFANIKTMPLLFPDVNLPQKPQDLKNPAPTITLPALPGIESAAQKQRDLEAYVKGAEEAERMLQGGMITVEEYNAALDDLASSYPKAADAATDAGKKTSTAAKMQKQALQEVSTIFNDLSRGIARSIVEWKGFGDLGKKVVKDLGEAMIRILINGAFKQLSGVIKDALGQMGELGKSISKFLGGGASSAANAANPGGLTSGIGGGASSGASAVVGAVAGVATAISSIVGNFQMAGMNKSLDLIVKHTLQTANQLIYGLQPQINTYLPALSGIHERLMEFRTSGLGVFPQPGYDWALGGGGGAGVQVNVSGNSFVGFRDMDAFVDELVRRIKARM